MQLTLQFHYPTNSPSTHTIDMQAITSKTNEQDSL